jgi:ABC-type methionine transport system ATPase subunit
VIGVRVRLSFPEPLVRAPVLARLVRRFDVEPNIRRADIEEHRGWVICEISGEATELDAALQWLRDEGVAVDLLGDVLEG